MNFVVCHKKYWKLVRNMPLYKYCFSFGCGVRADKNIIYSCCSFLSNVCWFAYDWCHAMAKRNIIFSFVWNQTDSYWNLQPLLPFSVKFHLLIFYWNVFQILFLTPFGGVYVKFRITFCFFYFLFPDIRIQWHYNLLTKRD